MSINLIICQSEITYPERSQNAQLQKYKPECCKISINMSKVYIVCIYLLFVIELHVVFQRMRQIYCIWWTSVIWPWSLRSITYNMIVKVAWYSAYSPEILLIKFICIVLYCIVLYCIVLCCVVLYCVVLYCINPFPPRPAKPAPYYFTLSKASRWERVITGPIYLSLFLNPFPRPLYYFMLSNARWFYSSRESL